MAYEDLSHISPERRAAIEELRDLHAWRNARRYRQKPITLMAWQGDDGEYLVLSGAREGWMSRYAFEHQFEPVEENDAHG